MFGFCQYFFPKFILVNFLYMYVSFWVCVFCFFFTKKCLLQCSKRKLPTGIRCRHASSYSVCQPIHSLCHVHNGHCYTIRNVCLRPITFFIFFFFKPLLAVRMSGLIVDPDCSLLHLLLFLFILLSLLPLDSAIQGNTILLLSLIKVS